MPVIRESVPHIYISALSFAPSASLVRKCYIDNLNGLPKMKGLIDKWPSAQIVIDVKSVVFAVAFSPNGRRIVSGSFDNTMQIWDAESGEAIGEPLQGHSSFVCSVAYSHDGRRIVSGSFDSTVRIWDAESGEAIGEPLHGHSSHV
jgi:WD40 repeat protein